MYLRICFVLFSGWGGGGGGGQNLLMLFESFSQIDVQQDFHITRCSCHSSVARQEPLDSAGFVIPNNTKTIINTF